MNKHKILKEYFGYTEFRYGQEKIIDNLLQQKDALCVMPTGAGKSLCYQVPALLMEGVTIVVSPLISLMKDQVNSLLQAGINAAYINSSLINSEYTEVIRNAYKGKYKLIYVAPERLLTDSFLRLSDEIKVSQVAVDEAHCISQWGQDFRPGYLKIAEFIDALKTRPVISAFTATATKEVKEDIRTLLNLKDPLTITTGFDRKNLYFSVRKPDKKPEELIRILKQRKDQSGIIYCSTRKTVDEIHDRLEAKGYHVTKYHAGLKDEERKSNQEDFLYDIKTIMVATNAFGMGIDKSNVSFVVHYNMPMSMESYYQEAGRAGRDGKDADCILLYSGQDIRINQFLIEKNEPNPELTVEQQKAVKDKDREKLKYMTYYCTTTDCLRAYILNYFGEKMESYCGNCSNCDEGYKLTDITIESQKILSCIYRTKQKYGMVMIMDILRGSKKAKILEIGLDQISTYGIMAGVTEPMMRSYINHLILNKYIDVSSGQYPILQLNENSLPVLKGEVKVEMKIPQAKEIAKPVEREESDKEKLLQLKAIRRRLASEERVPAFMIFSDKTLEEICRHRPKTMEEFLEIPGVGKRKQVKYGKIFLDVFR